MSDLAFGIIWWGWMIFLLTLMLMTSAAIGVMLSLMIQS